MCHRTMRLGERSKRSRRDRFSASRRELSVAAPRSIQHPARLAATRHRLQPRNFPRDDHERQHQLARNIHFAHWECQSRLHLTSFPADRLLPRPAASGGAMQFTSCSTTRSRRRCATRRTRRCARRSCSAPTSTRASRCAARRPARLGARPVADRLRGVEAAARLLHDRAAAGGGEGRPRRGRPPPAHAARQRRPPRRPPPLRPADREWRVAAPADDVRQPAVAAPRDVPEPAAPPTSR